MACDSVSRTLLVHTYDSYIALKMTNKTDGKNVVIATTTRGLFLVLPRSILYAPFVGE